MDIDKIKNMNDQKDDLQLDPPLADLIQQYSAKEYASQLVEDLLRLPSSTSKIAKRRSAEKNVTEAVSALVRNVNKTIDPDPPGWVDLVKIIPQFRIGHDLYERLTFRENLLVSVFADGASQPTPTGGLSLDVQQAKGNPLKHRNVVRSQLRKNKFLVHLSSELVVRGNNGGSRITAWIDKNFQTLEEKRTEFIYKGEPPIRDERNLYTSTQDLCYYLRRNRTDRIYYSPDKAQNLINEGANFVLMRYLAITRYIGNFEVATTYINGDLCRSIYECHGPESAMVNDIKLDVCVIYRTIIEECGLVHKSSSVLTLQGQIVKQDWENCPYVLHINPLAKIANVKPVGNEKVFMEKVWKTDMELLSRYLSYKTVTKKVISTYMQDYTQLRDLVADYMHIILQLKPDDVLEFTAKYFLSFAPELIPQSEYFDPGVHDRDSTESSDSEIWKYL